LSSDGLMQAAIAIYMTVELKARRKKQCIHL